MKTSMLATTLLTKPIQESRVAIIGGSIGGCAAAIALKRAGVPQIDIFERSSAQDLADRGLGIGLPTPVFHQLVQQDILDADMRFVETTQRHWVGTSGKVLYEQPMSVQLHNWGLLWNQLKKRIDANFRSGVTVDVSQTKIRHSGSTSTASVELFEEGSSSSSLGVYDFCIQADGALAAGSKANYAGYVLWRGSFPVANYPHLDLSNFPETFYTPVYKNGHGIVYFIPPASTTSNDHLMNFAIYTHTPPGLQGDYLYKVTRASKITPEQLDWFHNNAIAQMPPRFQEIVNVCVQEKTIAIHPILDRLPESFIAMDGLGLLLGDAGAVLRPHTGSGTTKAILEALLLQKLACAENATWNSVTEAYQTERYKDAQAKVALGERLGHAQVVETPDWETMVPADFEEWLAAQVADTGHYMYKGIQK